MNRFLEKREFYPIRLRRRAPFARGTPALAPTPYAEVGSGGGQARARPTAARRCTTAGRVAVDAPLLERDDRQPLARAIEQLALAQQERRIRRAAERFVAARERLVEQRAVGRECGEQLRKQRAMQVVDDDDRIEALRPRTATRPPSRSATRVVDAGRRRRAPPAHRRRGRPRATCAPRAAKKRAWRPRPAATSSTRAPAGTRCAKRSIHADGASAMCDRVSACSMRGAALGVASRASGAAVTSRGRPRRRSQRRNAATSSRSRGARRREREVAARRIVFAARTARRGGRRASARRSSAAGRARRPARRRPPASPGRRCETAARRRASIPAAPLDVSQLRQSSHGVRPSGSSRCSSTCLVRSAGARSGDAPRAIFGLATGVIRSPNRRTAFSGAAESGR